MKRLLKKVKQQTLFTQLLFTALAFIVMVVLSYIFMSAIVSGGLVRNADSVLDFAEERLSLDLFDAKSTLDGFSEIARDMILRGDTAAMLTEYINDVSYYVRLTGGKAVNIKDYYGYFETLPGGPVLIHSDTRILQEGHVPEEFLWYRLALAANGQIAETVPAITRTKETLFTYAKTIFDNEGRRLGVVCVNVQTDAIGQEVVNTALDQGGYGMLLNQKLLILSHPNTDFIGRYAYDPGIPLSMEIAVDLLDGREIFEHPMISYKGEKAVVFFRKLSNGWSLGLVTPKSQFYHNMPGMAAVLCLLGATLATALIIILVRIDRARVRSDEESKQKSAFLANMSHEIRTPINAIVGMTAIGKSAVSAERKDYCFSKIDGASKHLLGVINDILDISKIEANKIELSPVEFSFEKMLQHAVNVINFRVEERQQKLSVHIDKAIPKMIIADDQRFAQIITNLLSNAVKFTPEHGAIVLKTAFMGESNGVCIIQVEVTDTGIGISPEQRARIFHSFQQAESTTTRKYGGTGLGLAISKSIVEMMGGEIWVTSEPGNGSTFAFTVRALRGESVEDDAAAQNINWGNIRILTVDDDPDILEYFKEIVSSLGAHCEVASDAAEALRMVEQNGAYNIYFVDLKLPDINGISLTREIKLKEKDSGTSVVVMISSSEINEYEDEAKKAGVNKFLLKPLFPSAIADAITECIGVVNEKIEDVPMDINGIFAGKCVLLAEDIEINREIVQTVFSPTLLNIDNAENGVEAVRMFREAPGKYDLIFMDIQMPEMDGYDASRQIRALDLPRARTIPIVAMTANVFKEDIEHCLAAGMNSHLSKPLDMNELLETTLKYLGKNAVLNSAEAVK